MRGLLCFLGFHRWQHVQTALKGNLGITVFSHSECLSCGKPGHVTGFFIRG